MHDRFPCTLNMTSHEVRIARLRNLFLILSAITNFTPLTPEQLGKFNYDVGLFDSKITEEGKVSVGTRCLQVRNRELWWIPSPRQRLFLREYDDFQTALVQRIANILRNKFPLSHPGDSDQDEIHNR